LLRLLWRGSCLVVVDVDDFVVPDHETVLDPKKQEKTSENQSGIT
jgi:hypothetical protein